MRFDTSAEYDRYRKEKFQEEHGDQTIEEQLMIAISDRASTHWWYGQRWERLHDLLRGTDLEIQACSIMANGIADVHEQPTATQQFEMIKHDLAKARLVIMTIFASLQDTEFAEEVQKLCVQAGIMKEEDHA